MSFWKGKILEIETFGESHAEKIGVKGKNFPTVKIDEEKLDEFLKRRRSSGGVFSTARKEKDLPIFVKGYDNGAIGGDFEAIIKNSNVKSGDYDALFGKPRPSHADLCAFIKNGTLDFSGGGRFSGRLTAPIAIVGGILKQYLEERGIRIYAYLSKVGKVKGKGYSDGIDEAELKKEREFPSLARADEMLFEISEAKKSGDSVGAVAEAVVIGLKGGCGDDYFDGLEGKFSSLLYAIPAVKGVEFGAGFDFAEMRGSEANDPLRYEDGKVVSKTNNSGGINGGISNGMPITMRVAFRPTPSIAKEQETVDLIKKENAVIEIKGRHDACVAVRALPVIESMLAIAIADEILFEEKRK
ncbi:MAG: chorismate synthase [Clostridia bacterium]|nr:chorismate synthase [Clostridia bacterium]